jgi:transposase
VERSHWQIIWLLALGKPCEEVAAVTGYGVQWIRKLAGRYNREGATGIGDKRHQNPGKALRLDGQQQAALSAALDGPAADGGVWTGPKVAGWMSERLGRQVSAQRGWAMLRRLGYGSQSPRRRHVTADEETQAWFKKTTPA